MTGLVVLGIYLIGWFVTAVAAARYMAGNGGRTEYCHGEHRDGYMWSARNYCVERNRECWRSDGPSPVDVDDALLGSALALMWPLLAPMGLVYLTARRKAGSRLLTAAELADLERRAGINQ